MKLEQILTLAEIETWRSPESFVDWFEGLLNQIRQIDDENLRLQLLLHEDLAKRFYEELFPLYALLRKKKDAWSSVLVKNILGNQKGDVAVKKCGLLLPDIPDRFEITWAVNGWDHMMRMEHLIRHQQANMTGPVSVRREGGQRTVVIEPEAKQCSNTLAEVSALIQSRIDKKLTKNYAKGTALIIYVEDFGMFAGPKHLKELEVVLNANCCQLKQVFQTAFLVVSSNLAVVEI